MEIIQVSSTLNLQKCLDIRRRVFIEEQKVPEEHELADSKNSVSFLAIFENKPVGTIRVRFINPNKTKIERLAVLKECRNKGVGRKLLEKAISFCKEKSVKGVMMNAQYYLKEYYESFGFKAVGEPFVEAGIKHIEMRLL